MPKKKPTTPRAPKTLAEQFDEQVRLASADVDIAGWPARQLHAQLAIALAIRILAEKVAAGSAGAMVGGALSGIGSLLGATPRAPADEPNPLTPLFTFKGG